METLERDPTELLRQDFLFQGASTRVRVSVSRDGRYVLKTPLKTEEIEAAFRRYGIDLGAVDWAPIKGNAFGSAEVLGRLSMESYSVAWTRLRDESALLYVGPHPDNASLFVILQRRVQLFVDFVSQMMSKGQATVAQWAIDELLALTHKLWSQGITENTFNFADNYGFMQESTGPRIVLVDIGELETGAENVSRYAQEETMLKSQSFVRWLRPTHPHLANHLEQGFKALSRQFA